MSSNLPPGVTESMIPGNRPEDIAWQQEFDRLLEDEELTEEEAEERMKDWYPEDDEPDYDSMPGGADDYDAFRGSEVDDC